MHVHFNFKTWSSFFFQFTQGFVSLPNSWFTQPFQTISYFLSRETWSLIRVRNLKHCVKSVRIRSYSGPYSVRMREIVDQKNSEYRHFSRSEDDHDTTKMPINVEMKKLEMYTPNSNAGEKSKQFLISCMFVVVKAS